MVLKEKEAKEIAHGQEGGSHGSHTKECKVQTPSNKNNELNITIIINKKYKEIPMPFKGGWTGEKLQSMQESKEKVKRKIQISFHLYISIHS